MARKITTEAKLTQVNVRLPEKLRLMLQEEAKTHGWSFNRELVQRLQHSFFNQGTDAMIRVAVMSVAQEIRKDLIDHMANIHDHVDKIAKAMGRPDLVADLKSEGKQNG